MPKEPLPAEGTELPPEAWDGVERRSGDKRRRHRRYRFIDRRSGFDRRKRYPIFGTMRDHPWLVLFVIGLLNLLSFADGYFTAAEIGLGIASEGNPVLAAASAQSPWLAVAVKLGGIAVASIGIWMGRRRRFILALSIAALGVFAWVVAYHWGMLSGLGWL